MIVYKMHVIQNISFHNLEGERWRYIKDFPQIYKISNKGRVYSERIKNIKKQHTHISGYNVVGLYIKINGKGLIKTPKIHVLVANAFIPNPNNYKLVNHKDGNKLNNNVENLEWCSSSQNRIHALGNNLAKCKGIKINQLDLQGNIIKTFDSAADAGRWLSLRSNSINAVCRGRYKTCGGFKWEYVNKPIIDGISEELAEFWMEIEGYPNYWISTMGSVYNSKTRRLKKKHINSGYYSVNVCDDKKKQFSIRIHRLVAKTFIKNPNGKNFVNHKDGNKLNNNVENLEWCSKKENSLHSYKMGLSVSRGKKAVKQYSLDGIFIKQFSSITEAAKNLGSMTGISLCCNGKRNKAHGFKWSYA